MNNGVEKAAEGLAQIDLNAQQPIPNNPSQPNIQAQNPEPHDDQNLIVNQLKVITHELCSQGTHNIIENFDGTNPKAFRPWIKEVRKYCELVSADDDRIKRVLYGTSRGVVSSFIERFFRDKPEAPSNDLIKELTSRFSDVIDEHSALVLFRKVSQGKNENKVILEKLKHC